MGYSARYHAFSIIAVFAALAVGIVIGAGLGDELVSGTTKNLEESLKEDVKDLRAREDELGSELEREADFGVEVYPDLVGGRLNGDSVAVISLGGQPEGVADDVAAALDPTGAIVERDAVVRLPPDLEEASEELGDTRLGRLAADPAQAGEFARLLGHQLVRGGSLLRDARGALFDEFSGEDGRVDRVVIMRASPEGMDSAEQEAADEFERGILAGMESSGAPVVGVERRDTSPSTVPFFDEQGVTTVDSVDLTSGKVALVFSLLGAQGSYGVKDTADSLLPELVLEPAKDGGDSQRNGPEGQAQEQEQGQRQG